MSSGKYCFETLPKARGSVNEVKIGGETAEVCEIQITYDNPKNLEFSVELPLEDNTFASLQGNDPKIRDLHLKVEEGEYSQFYFVRNNVLFRSIVENGHKFEVRVIPESSDRMSYFIWATTNLDTMDTRGHMQQSSICTTGKSMRNACIALLQKL